MSYKKNLFAHLKVTRSCLNTYHVDSKYLLVLSIKYQDYHDSIDGIEDSLVLTFL